MLSHMFLLTFQTNMLPLFSLTLKMEAAGSYKTVPTYDTTWSHSLDDHNLKKLFEYDLMQLMCFQKH